MKARMRNFRNEWERITTKSSEQRGKNRGISINDGEKRIVKTQGGRRSWGEKIPLMGGVKHMVCFKRGLGLIRLEKEASPGHSLMCQHH